MLVILNPDNKIWYYYSFCLPEPKKILIQKIRRCFWTQIPRNGDVTDNVYETAYYVIQLLYSLLVYQFILTIVKI